MTVSDYERKHQKDHNKTSKDQKYKKLTRITNDEISIKKFSLNVSRCANRDVISLS